MHKLQDKRICTKLFLSSNINIHIKIEHFLITFELEINDYTEDKSSHNMSLELETRQIEFSTNGRTQIIDITDMVQNEIHDAGFTEGQATLFAIGSTTGLSTIVL